MAVAYSDNLIYNSRVDSSTERKGASLSTLPHIYTKAEHEKAVFMGKRIDLAGQKFGRLTVIRSAGTQNNRAMWLCRCECGKELIVEGHKLRNGNTKSCGCYQRDRAKESQTRHNGSSSRLYGVWACMVQRCTNPNNNSYKRYGARGIKVCNDWLDFGKFQEWAMANGYNPNAKRNECTLDRINNNGNYESSNCRWITHKEQTHNTRRNHNITINGETHCISEWARIYNIKRETIKDRILSGWDEVKAVTTPVKEKV